MGPHSEYALLSDDSFGDPRQAAQGLPVFQAPADKEFLFLTHGDAPPQYPEIDEE
jgi:hypothetical protein